MGAVVERDIYNSATYGLNIIINGNGGSAPASVSAYKTSNASSVKVSKEIPSTTPTRTGYTFLGYAVGSASNAVSQQPGNTLSYSFSRVVTGSTTSTHTEGGITYRDTIYSCRNQAYDYNLYAKWQALTYTVSYNAGGGNGAPGSQTKTYGVNLTLSSTVPTWAGHTFVEWNTAANGSGTSYNPGATFTANANTTLYAIWSTNTYTVSYNANGGSGAPANQTKTYGVALALSATVPTRSGYGFVAWNTQADGSGTTYHPGDGYTANAALTLYAIWQQSTYTVTYNANGKGTAPDPQTKQYGGSVTIADAITYTGLTMTEWNTAADGTGTSYSPGDTYSADADLTLYAIWTVASYTVTFDADGGTVSPAAKTVTLGDKYGELPVPEKTGETFYGWFLDDLLITANSVVEIQEDSTLTAAWTIRSSGRVVSNGNLYTGAWYVKSGANMLLGIAYAKGTDGQMHVNG